MISLIVVSGCGPLDKPGQSRAVPMVEKNDVSHKEDIPVVAAAEVEEVIEEDLLPEEMAQTTEERLLIIEDRLNRLRQEMNLLRPAIKELISSQNLAARISEQETPLQLSPQVETHPKEVQKENAVPVSVEPKVDIPLKPAVVAKVPKTYKGAAKLANIRMGEHPGKTRFVMDVGSQTPFSYDLDNEERVLVIELPEAQHEQKMTATISQSPYISSYVTQASEKGSRIIVQLKQPVKVIAAETIGATPMQGQRIYFDIGKG